ncbi:MAG: hypothetical protein RRZ83_05485 [Alistipes sp.]
MRKLHSIILSFAVISMTASFMSCAKDESEIGNSEIVVPEAYPTEDAMKVNSSLKTYVLQHDYTETMKALVNRMKNPAATLDETVKTVIIHADDVTKLTDAQYEAILRIFANNGNIVIGMPSVTQWNLFAKSLFATFGRMVTTNQLPPNLVNEKLTVIQALNDKLTDKHLTHYIYADGVGTDSEHFCDMVALRSNDIYYLDDLNDAHEPESTYTVVSTDQDGNESSKELVGDQLKTDLTAYTYGSYADKITAWLNEQPNHEKEMKKKMAYGRTLLSGAGAGEADLKKLMSAQTIRYDSWTTAFARVGATASVTYDIWAVNDLDQHIDYYLVHQCIDSRNSQLECGPTDRYQYFGVWIDKYLWSAYGAYMKDIETSSSLLENNASSVELRDHQPLTSQGSSSHSTGMSWNLGGNVGVSASGPSAGVSGGVSFSESWTTNTLDLSIIANTDGHNPTWIYNGAIPHSHRDPYCWHDIAAGILTNDCQVNNTWIWRQPNASGTYAMQCDVNIRTDVLVVYYGYSVSENHYNENNENHYTLNLTPPARATQRWQMSCASNEDVSSYLKTNYPDFWLPSLKIYTSTPEDRLAVDAFFASFISVISKDKKTWKDNGHTGTYTFKVKLEGSEDYYKTYKFDVQ